MCLIRKNGGIDLSHSLEIQESHFTKDRKDERYVYDMFMVDCLGGQWLLDGIGEESKVKK